MPGGANQLRTARTHRPARQSRLRQARDAHHSSRQLGLTSSAVVRAASSAPMADSRRLTSSATAGVACGDSTSRSPLPRTDPSATACDPPSCAPSSWLCPAELANAAGGVVGAGGPWCALAVAVAC